MMSNTEAYKEQTVEVLESINCNNNDDSKAKEFIEYLEKELDTPYKGERKCYERVLEQFKKIYNLE